MRKLLCVTAHPDDEVANFGGTVSHYARLGVHCRLICLTAGESAKNRGAATDPAALKALRREELAASCKLLEFASHEVWDMGDARLPQAPFYYVLSRLVSEIRKFQPEVVLSFGPEGSLTAHPDHGMAGTFATTAFHWAAREKFFPELNLPPFQAQRLYYATAAFQPPQFDPVWLPFPDVAMPVGEFLDARSQPLACIAPRRRCWNASPPSCGSRATRSSSISPQASRCPRRARWQTYGPGYNDSPHETQPSMDQPRRPRGPPHATFDRSGERRE